MRRRSGHVAVCSWVVALATLAAAPFVRVSAQGSDKKPEAISLFGAPLRPVPGSPAAVERLSANLEQATDAYNDSPSADGLIWVGRRMAYLGHFRDAIAIFTKGIAQYPTDARFYRHRGHRYITTRQFGRAAADLERAAVLLRGTRDQIEPDGQPNARNIPTSTLQFNIWYHLGLAYYLQGQFERAREAYAQCLQVSQNPDAQVATRHWLYMTLRRLKLPTEAGVVLETVDENMDIIENRSYHRLLLMYRGKLSPEALLDESTAALDRTTVTYGVANWHRYNGRTAEAVALLRTIVHGPQWTAFGSIAAEADLKHLGEAP